jgi:hypothetical protein
MKKNKRTGHKEGFFTVTFLPFGVQITEIVSNGGEGASFRDKM